MHLDNVQSCERARQEKLGVCPRERYDFRYIVLAGVFMKSAAAWVGLLGGALLFAPSGVGAELSGVSLHVKDATPQVAFEKLFADMSLKLMPAANQMWEKFSYQSVTMDVSNGKFWDVMTELNRATGVCMSQVKGDEVAIYMDHGLFSRRPFVVVGPLRVSAVRAESQWTMELNKTRQSSKSCKIELQVMSDPRYHPIALEENQPEAPANSTPGPRGARPVQSRTQPISFTSGTANFFVDVEADASRSTVDVNRSYLLSRATRLNAVTVMIGTNGDRIEKDLGDFKATLEFRTTPNGFSGHLTLVNQRLDPRQWIRVATAVTFNPPTLTDSAGKPYMNNGGGGNRNGNITQTVNFIVDRNQGAVGPPHKLLWNVPVAIETEPVSIELKNLQLP